MKKKDPIYIQKISEMGAAKKKPKSKDSKLRRQ
jgi:hypothetical protein